MGIFGNKLEEKNEKFAHKEKMAAIDAKKELDLAKIAEKRAKNDNKTAIKRDKIAKQRDAIAAESSPAAQEKQAKMFIAEQDTKQAKIQANAQKTEAFTEMLSSISSSNAEKSIAEQETMRSPEHTKQVQAMAEAEARSTEAKEETKQAKIHEKTALRSQEMAIEAEKEKRNEVYAATAAIEQAKTDRVRIEEQEKTERNRLEIQLEAMKTVLDYKKSEQAEERKVIESDKDRVYSQYNKELDSLNADVRELNQQLLSETDERKKAYIKDLIIQKERRITEARIAFENDKLDIKDKESNRLSAALESPFSSMKKIIGKVTEKLNLSSNIINSIEEK